MYERRPLSLIVRRADLRPDDRLVRRAAGRTLVFGQFKRVAKRRVARRLGDTACERDQARDLVCGCDDAVAEVDDQGLETGGQLRRQLLEQLRLLPVVELGGDSER